MVKCKCKERVRDKNGNIIKYILVDENTIEKEFSPEETKNLIRLYKIQVSNLTLTKNNKLVFKQDKEELNATTKNNTTSKEEKIILGNGSTGETFRIGDVVYKNTTFALNGQNTPETKAYLTLNKFDGILPFKFAVYEDISKITTPYCQMVFSVDTIPREKREVYGKLIKEKDILEMVRIVNYITNKGICYNDYMQFAKYEDKMRLFDFSNVEFEDKRKSDEILESNYSDLRQFLIAFGLTFYSDFIGKAIRTLQLLQLYSPQKIKEDKFVFLAEKEKNELKEIYSQREEKFHSVYFSKNLRTIPGVANLLYENNGITRNLIFSKDKLTNEFLNEWELIPIYVYKN